MNAEKRAELRTLANALPTIIFHSDTLWYDTTHERIEHLDAHPEEADDVEVWPTGPGYDVEPDLGTFIESARAAVPALLDTIDAVLALHQRMHRSGVRPSTSDTLTGQERWYCTCCLYEDGSPEKYPCRTVRAIEGAS